MPKISVIVFLFLVSFFPGQAHAQYIDISTAAKDYGLDFIARTVAQQAIQKLTAQTVNWINSGFKGNPAYVTDPGQFFLDIGDREASRFLSTAGMSNLCSPFQAKVRLALVKNYLAETGGNYSCTLSRVKNNYEQFVNDFSQGGWDGWFEVTQNANNNPYGSYLSAQNSLYEQLASEQERYKDQLEWGQGFLSYEKETCNGTEQPVYRCADGTEAGHGAPVTGLCQFGAKPVATCPDGSHPKTYPD